jgi:hypothetical protein
VTKKKYANPNPLTPKCREEMGQKEVKYRRKEGKRREDGESSLSI